MNKPDFLSIFNKFEVREASYSFNKISMGFINQTYIVTDSKTNANIYILQQINHSIFKNIEALQNNISYSLPLLKKHGAYKSIRLIETKSKKKYLKVGGDYWRVFTAVDKAVTYDTCPNPLVAFEAGRIIGLFHSLLEPLSSNLIIETIPDFHNLDIRLKQLDDALSNTSNLLKNRAKKEVEFVEKTKMVFTSLKMSEIPLRICHNDTKLNNIIFDKNHNAKCLIDLDTIMNGHLLYDTGDALRIICNSVTEDEKDLSKMSFNLEYFEQFVQGFIASGIKITPKEIKSISLGVAYMPFIHGIRAITDFLQGNKYYTVSYPDENLDRGKNLLKFSAIALQKLDDMNAILNKIG